jgi:hypothetical protein
LFDPVLKPGEFSDWLAGGYVSSSLIPAFVPGVALTLQGKTKFSYVRSLPINTKFH